MTTGASTRQISDELVLSLDPVQSQVKHILHKLGVHSPAEAVAGGHDLRRHRQSTAN